MRKIWLISISVGIFGLMVCCGSKRIKNIAQDGRDKSEEQIRADRSIKKAEGYFESGDFNEARKAYLQALHDDPACYQAHLGLADCYDRQGEKIAAIIEYVAHTEIAPKSKYYVERMLPYVFSKFSRNPLGPKDIDEKVLARAMRSLSEAVIMFLDKNYEATIQKLAEVHDQLPHAAIADYLEGSAWLRIGKQDLAKTALGRAVSENAYFVKLLLDERMEQSLPGLLLILVDELEKGLQAHPTDTDTAYLLGVLQFRLGNFEEALKVLQKSLAWGDTRWDVLVVQAAAYQGSKQASLMKKTLEELVKIHSDFSDAFYFSEPSMFKGLLGGLANSMLTENLAPLLQEPARLYFLWRLADEANEVDSANQRKTAFIETLKNQFPDGEFSTANSVPTNAEKPRNQGEFLGAVQNTISSAMDSFSHCDTARKSLRARASGRITLRVDLGSDGRVAQVGIVENSTLDPWLAYCMVQKVNSINFPKPFRIAESFKIPILVGPEVEENQKPNSEMKSQL